MKAVIDTNVLVSALWKETGNAFYILSEIVSGRITVCYDRRITDEYTEVLLRPKFGFPSKTVNALMDYIIEYGLAVSPHPIRDILFIDEDDRPFYEVAEYCDAKLVTGNKKHFPEDPRVLTPAEFIEYYKTNHI